MFFLDRLIGKQIRKPSGFLGSLFGYLMAANHKEITDWTFDQLQVKNNNYVLDIGCGSGVGIEKLNMIITDGYIVGIDYSCVMLRQAARRNRLVISKGRARLCYGNISTLPFTDASFDKVYAIESFYFWPNPSKDLQEVKRVLKPGGSVAISMEISKEGTNRKYIEDNARRLGIPIYSGREMEALLCEAGFINVGYKAVPEREKGWLCAIGSTHK
jgi:ubiquinone/menaquinone biosynthesis C-methylase UbiE